MNRQIKNILKRLLTDNYKKFVQSPMNEKKRIVREIDSLNARQSVARNKLLSETIDYEEYLDIKRECRDKIEKLEEQLSKDGSDTKQINIDRVLDKAIQNIVNIPRHYSEGGIHTKRAIIGSIFPEKLEFDGKTYRTARMNVIANCIFQLNNGLLQNKSRRSDNFNHFSCFVPGMGIEPTRPNGHMALNHACLPVPAPR